MTFLVLGLAAAIVTWTFQSGTILGEHPYMKREDEKWVRATGIRRYLDILAGKKSETSYRIPEVDSVQGWIQRKIFLLYSCRPCLAFWATLAIKYGGEHSYRPLVAVSWVELIAAWAIAAIVASHTV